jgi:YgiT-type zinc finger domain-containing protein
MKKITAKKKPWPCTCGGSLQPRKVAKFDFSPLADGLQVTLENVPVLRCGRCGNETLDGAIIDGTLNALAHSVATAKARLGGIELRFLRKHLLLTQQELATRLECNRVTVADWERDAQPISEHHELRVRALVLGGKDLQQNLETFEEALQAAFAAARNIQPGAEQLLANALALLTKAAEPTTASPTTAHTHVIDAGRLERRAG